MGETRPTSQLTRRNLLRTATTAAAGVALTPGLAGALQGTAARCRVVGRS